MQYNKLNLCLLSNFRSYSPLVHCITNTVVQCFTANVLLSIGASPIIITENNEAKQFASIADALLINVGTITYEQSNAMLLAIKSAISANKPWILDPVAIGQLTFRTNFCHQVINLKPSVIRANASEILALSSINKGGRGVDSKDNTINALYAAKKLAYSTNSIIALTGEIDYVTDGKKTIEITGGSNMMTKVTGIGCALSAVIAASCSLPGNKLDNVASVCKFMKYAGEIAAKKSTGPSSFSMFFIDTLYHLGD